MKTLLFVAATAIVLSAQTPLGLDAYLPAPATNPLTPENVALGRSLFFDKRLSRDGSIACATCHDPAHGFTDSNPVAVGVGHLEGPRRTPSLLNRAWGRSFFWDGREAALEEQVVLPISNPKEMDLPLEEAAARVGVDSAAMKQALASYVRSILSGNSPYDRYLAGDATALSPAARRGLGIFRGKGNCTACHLGPNLTDERFHNTGLESQDPGRYAVTQSEADRGAFKTPTLRDIAKRPPYMHDGSLATLADVIEHYGKGGTPNPHLDPEIRPMDLTDKEKRDLEAFLEALTGCVVEGRWPLNQSASCAQ